jgi:hypothetical protein
MAEMIDPTIERKAIYKSFKGKPGPCPKCGGVLKQSHQSYMLATQTGGRKADSFMVGGDFGWSCAFCPTVVLNKDELGKMLSYSMPGWKIGKEIAMLGILDLDAVPANKSHLLLGSPGNPVPLVKFSGRGGSESGKSTVNSKQNKSRR